MKLKTFYRLLGEAVKYYPQHREKCKVLQTFAVLDDLGKLDASNLGMTIHDKHSEFFYSRAWENLKYNPSKVTWDYPALIVLETDSDLENLFKKEVTTCYTLELRVVDKLDRPCLDTPDCKKKCGSRNVSEVYCDTETLLRGVLRYFDGVKYYKHSNGEGYFHMGCISALENPVEVLAKTKKAHIKLCHTGGEGGRFTSFRWTGGVAGNLATTIRLRFCVTDCVEVDFDFSRKDVIVKPSIENCC